MPSCVVMPSPQDSQSAPLTEAQLRDLLRQALDRLAALKAESSAAQDYIATLSKASVKDAELITALKERDAIRQDTIKALDAQIAALNQTLAVSEKARADAVKEADRQRKRAGRWKKLAMIGSVAGLAAGAAAVLLIRR